MLLKRRFTQQTKNGVQIGNGTVSFQSVQLNVHCFVADGVLIDTGAKSLEQQFTPFFKQQNINQVAITHFHEDHTGTAAILQNELKLPIYMSDKMLDYCKQKPDYPLYRKLFWGKRKPFHAVAIGRTFSSRNSIWDVIETPGHAIDHLAFLNRETGQLFTGDLYCQEKTKVILREESIPTIIDSLKKVLTYDFEEVFCSHAGYLEDGRSALQKKLDYLLDLQGKVIKLNEDGLSPNQISKILFPKKYPITYLSSGEWESLHIINSIIQK
ncbi:glyoxylase-like metal-dependent hydrolase (beta-lactamase superfamily II) [Cytobacillus eiseniae]|uniref:Glyoxylase-like metal-dependent hydrolase (Beta-lactamase superfamily II) n=1 Tax=Cytobacillus eiseniae TaxID=762947 RepID=A0ABS4R9E4_9BACI|nr:MBL fold metallo-hydrolase [Cytobacillus eiseniae]MBP2239508.1 glyoxylase-like metal-dependent hydrolase (beta-lactamase superfamily II) [Cytobacillus eiseniae]